MSHSRPGPWATFFGVAILLWLLFAGLEVGLSCVVNQTGMREPGLDGGHKAGLLATELAAGFGAVVAFCLLAAPLVRLGRWRWWCRLPLVVVVFLLTYLYIGSWVSFRMSARFIDVGGVLMWNANRVQFMQHVAQTDPWVVVLTPMAAVIVATFGPWGLLRLTAAAPAGLRRAVGRGAIGLLIVATGVAVWGHVRYADSRAAVQMNLYVVPPEEGRVYRFVRDERTGPVLHVLADVHRWLFRRPAPLAPDPAIVVVRQPQVPLATWVSAVDRAKVKPWNVVVLIVESLRPDQLQVYGGGREVMPAVESIAREALLPARCYTQASHSNYADLCPLSSHYPLRGKGLHIYPEDPPYPRILIYDLLKALGWRTGIFSSQNETWGRMDRYLESGSLDRFLHAETYEGETYVPRKDTDFASWVKGNKRAGKIDDRFTVDEAIKWIDEDPSKPFCIYMNLQNSHVPYEIPSDFPHRFGPDPKSLDFPILFASFPPDQAGVVKDLYADSLAYVDHQIGRLVARLKATGRWKDTLFVVTGDTGQAFYEHGFASHASHVFDEVMQVPLIIRVPGETSRRLDRTAQHVDVLPTLLHLLGLPPHPTCQGLDLLAEDFPSPRSVYGLVQNGVYEEYAIVQWPWKLITFVRWDHEMLFDLSQDPGERVNVLDDNRAVADRLRRRLATWRFEQLDFYREEKRYRNEYPPVLQDG